MSVEAVRVGNRRRGGLRSSRRAVSGRGHSGSDKSYLTESSRTVSETPRRWNMLNDVIDSFQDLVDLDNVEIKPVFAKLLFKKLTEWKKNDGKVPRAYYLQQIRLASKRHQW